MSKIIIKDMKKLKSFCDIYGTPEDACNDFIKLHYGHLKDVKKLVERYKKHKSNDRLYYYGMYLWIFKLPQMINKYYDTNIFTTKKINEQLIITNGNSFSDGFAGVKVKKMSYDDYYILEIVDGENGQLFCKTYKKLPTIKQLEYDTVFKYILDNNYNKNNKYKKSVYELFNIKQY